MVFARLVSVKLPNNETYVRKLKNGHKRPYIDAGYAVTLFALKSFESQDPN